MSEWFSRSSQRGGEGCIGKFVIRSERVPWRLAWMKNFWIGFSTSRRRRVKNIQNRLKHDSIRYLSITSSFHSYYQLQVFKQFSTLAIIWNEFYNRVKVKRNLIFQNIGPNTRYMKEPKGKIDFPYRPNEKKKKKNDKIHSTTTEKASTVTSDVLSHKFPLL